MHLYTYGHFLWELYLHSSWNKVIVIRVIWEIIYKCIKCKHSHKLTQWPRQWQQQHIGSSSGSINCLFQFLCLVFLFLFFACAGARLVLRSSKQTAQRAIINTCKPNGWSKKKRSKKAFIEHFMKSLVLSLSVFWFRCCCCCCCGGLFGVFQALLRHIFVVVASSFHWIACSVCIVYVQTLWNQVTDRKIDVPLQLFWRFWYEFQHFVRFLMATFQISNFTCCCWILIRFASKSVFLSHRCKWFCLKWVKLNEAEVCVYFSAFALFLHLLSFPFALALHESRWCCCCCCYSHRFCLTLLLMLQLNKWQITRKMHDICRSL